MTVYVMATTPCSPADMALLARLANRNTRVRAAVVDIPNWDSTRPCVVAEVERTLVRPRPKKRIPARKAAS